MIPLLLRRLSGLLLASLLFLTPGCERDLDVPEGPQRGSLKGVVDTGGHLTPLDQRVVLISESGSELEQRTREDGSFVFGDLPPGLFYLELSLPGFAPLVRPSLRIRVGEEVDVGSLSPLWLLGTTSEATLIGKVAAGAGGDVNGARVEFILQQGSAPIAVAIADGEGTFVQRVPPGLYTLKVSHPHYVTATATDIALFDGERRDLTSAPIVMDVNPATLTGSVLRERDGANAVPAVDALVTLGSGATTTTDSEGTFRFQGLAAGSQSIRFALPNHHDVGTTRTVVLSAGETTAFDPVRLMLDRGSFSGTVVLSDQQQALGVSVSVNGTPYNGSVTPTSSEPWKGSYLISGVPVGSYELVAARAATDSATYAPATAVAQQISKDAVTAVSDLTLIPLNGKLTVDDGDPTSLAGFTRTRTVTVAFADTTGATEYRLSEDPGFTSVPFVALTPGGAPFPLEDTQGTHVIYGQYRHVSGTVSRTFSASIVLDSVAPANPSIVIEEGADFTRQAQVLRVKLEAEDRSPVDGSTVSGLAWVRLSESGATSADGLTLLAPEVSYQQSVAYPRQSGADGLQRLYVQFVDRAGNASAIASDEIQVDTLAPLGDLAILPGELATDDQYTRDVSVNLASTLSTTEPPGGFVQIKFANSVGGLAAATYQSWEPAMSTFLAPGGDGPRTVYAMLRDAAGNTSNTITAGIMLDRTPPSPVGATAPAVTASRNVTLQLSAVDDRLMSPTKAVTVWEGQLGTPLGTVGPVGFPIDSQIAFVLDADEIDPKQLHVLFRDAAGNEAKVIVPIRLDTLAPSLRSFQMVGTLADGEPSSVHTSTQNVTLELDQTGASEFLVSASEPSGGCPSAGYSPLTSSSIPYTLPGIGPREVWLCLRDAAGNRSDPRRAGISVDTSVPTGCTARLLGKRVDGAAAPDGLTATRSVGQALDGCTEIPAEVYFTESSTTCSASANFVWQKYSPELEIPLSSGDGSKTMRGCVRDAARNTGSIAPDTITLDTTRPANPSVVIAGGAAFVSAAQVADGGYEVSVTGDASGATEWALGESSAPASFTSFDSSTASFTFGGGGRRTVFAVFRDQVGNLSDEVFDSIMFDEVAPSIDGVSFLIRSPTDNGLTNNRTVGVGLSFAAPPEPAEVHDVLLVEAANPAACAEADFIGAVPMQRFKDGAHLLTDGDGVKRLCLRLRDQAGNGSAILSDAITLDATPPSAPVITTPPQIVSVINGSFEVTTGGPVTDAHFFRYETSDTNAAWVPGSTSRTTTSFSFPLTSETVRAGRTHVLRIRARDQAGNAGPESSVSIVNDTMPPVAPQVRTEWVDNRTGRATLHWVPSPDEGVNRDVIVRYEVLYGSSPGAYFGQYAYEGVSPLKVSPQTTSQGLSGLVDGTFTYVRVRAVDHAGNVATSALEAVLEPNIVSPTQIGNPGTLSTGNVRALLPQGDLLYAVVTSGNNCASNGRANLRILDLSKLASPLRTGTITDAVIPGVLGGVSFTELIDCVQHTGDINVVVEGPWAFMPVGNNLYIIDVMDPTSPRTLAPIDLGFPLHHVVVRGKRLFVYGRPNRIFALDLSKLYDQDSETVPTATDVIGIVPTAFANSGGMVLTRNTLLQFDQSIGNALTVTVRHALDDDPATVWDGGDVVGSRSLGSSATQFGRSSSASGNYLYLQGGIGTRIFNLKEMWNLATPLSSTQLKWNHTGVVSSATGMNILGTELFAFDGPLTRFRSFDISDASAPVAQAGYKSEFSSSSMTTYGPYMFGSLPNNGLLSAYETARPDSLRIRTRSAGIASPGGEVEGGFYYGNATVFDLQSGAPTLVDSLQNICTYDQARFEDRILQARGRNLVVWNYDNAVDRDRDPNPLFFSNLNQAIYTLPSPTFDTFAKAVKAYGNFAIVVETRSDGTYLEVFDMHRVRNGGSSANVALSAADSRGAYRFTADVGRPVLAMSRGRAFVGLDRGSTGVVYAVDLRAMLDDDGDTQMVAFTEPGQTTVQGPVQISGAPFVSGTVRNIVVRGTWAYVAGPTGLTTIDVAAALDEDPGVLTPGLVPVTLPTTMSNGATAAVSGLAVYGSYAFVTLLVGSLSGIPSDTLAIDVSNPAAPFVISRLPVSSTRRACSIDTFNNIEMRESVQVLGSRAYVGYPHEMYVMDLE